MLRNDGGFVYDLIRQFLLLKGEEGATAKEISKFSGVKVKTVWKYLSRAEKAGLITAPESKSKFRRFGKRKINSESGWANLLARGNERMRALNNESIKGESAKDMFNCINTL